MPKRTEPRLFVKLQPLPQLFRIVLAATLIMAALGTAIDLEPTTTTHNEQISGRNSALSKNTCLLSSKDCLNSYNQNQYIAISQPSINDN